MRRSTKSLVAIAFSGGLTVISCVFVYLLLEHLRTESPPMKALDRLENRFGKETVTVGRISRSANLDWFMTASSKSPCYTTRWQDIPIIR